MGHWLMGMPTADRGSIGIGERVYSQWVEWGHWSTSTALLHGAEVSVSLWLLSECFSSDVTELFTFMKLILIEIEYISICRLAFVKKRVNGILSSKFSKIF